jgi:hypothetical protein
MAALVLSIAGAAAGGSVLATHIHSVAVAWPQAVARILGRK